MADEIDQQSLIKGIRSGRAEAAEELHRWLSSRLMPYIRRKVGTKLGVRLDAEDVFNDTFTEILKIVQKGDRPIRYLDRLSLVISRSVIASQARRRSINFKRLDSSDSRKTTTYTQEPEARTSGAHTKFVRVEKKQLIAEALSQLRPVPAAIVRLRFSEPKGKNQFKEIAKTVGMTPEATEKAYLRAIQKMKEYLQRHHGQTFDPDGGGA